MAQGQSKTLSTRHKYNSQDDAGAGFPIDPPGGHMRKGYYQTSSVVHPIATRNKNASNRIGAELRSERSQHPQADASLRSNDRIFTREPVMVINLSNFSVLFACFVILENHMQSVL